MDKKALHDKLLGEKPDGAEHEASACPFCNVEKASMEEKKMADEKLYDQTQLDSLVSAAVEKAVGELKEAHDKELVAVRAELAQATEDLEKASADAEILRAEAAEKAEAEKLRVLGDERAARVEEVASFTDEELGERKARWAAMSDEDFEQTLRDFAAIATAAKNSSEESVEKKKLPESKFGQEREEASDKSGEAPAFALIRGMN
jgi:hypothetical protein